jgi:hypothetical protein
MARHSAQIGLYRRVLATLTGLPIAAVSADGVFTETAVRWPLPVGD